MEAAGGAAAQGYPAHERAAVGKVCAGAARRRAPRTTRSFIHSTRASPIGAAAEARRRTHARRRSERQCLGRKSADASSPQTRLTGGGITRCWAELHDSGLRAAPLPATRGLREMPAGPGSSSRRRRRRRLASFASSCCLAPWARAPGIYVRGRWRGCPMRRLLSSLWLLCLPEWYLLWPYRQWVGTDSYCGHAHYGAPRT